MSLRGCQSARGSRPSKAAKGVEGEGGLAQAKKKRIISGSSQILAPASFGSAHTAYPTHCLSCI
jgi:hypothetical protein